jgi:hypothetical protein
MQLNQPAAVFILGSHHVLQVAPQEPVKTGSKFALRLCLPAGTDMKGMSPPGLIELSGPVVVGRNPGNVPGAKSVAIDCGPTSGEHSCPVPTLPRWACAR